MGLDDFLDNEEKLGDHFAKFLRLKKIFQEEGLPENIATYKASQVLTPEKLEKIHLLTQGEVGYRPSLNFFFDKEEEIELVTKYFNVSFAQKAVKSSKLLIELLKLLDKL